MQTAYSFAVNHDEAAMLIATNGHAVSYILEGEPGVGKSSLLKTMRTALNDVEGVKYDYIYVDVPMKDIPDIALSMPNHTNQTTMAYINSLWLGTDPKKPKVIMMDEVFKGNEYVKLMVNRLLLEHTVGDYKLPEGSITFGTTNFQSDGVGDRTNAHTNSRVIRVPMRKPTMEEWVTWAVNNDIHPLVLTWANQNPSIFRSYKDTEYVEDNKKNGDGNNLFHYIYHPQHNSQAYVCPRTLALASHQIKNMDKTGQALLEKALIGTLGHKAAMDMAAMIALGNDLPHPDDIIKNPSNARVPKSGPAQLMMAFKSLQYINRETMDAFAIYMERLPIEIYSVWARTMITSSIKDYAFHNARVKKVLVEQSWVF